ncbi:MAG: serine/threonine protein kinase [Gammaproteobacteria bacterium]
MNNTAQPADASATDYAGLTPDVLLDAVESCGYLTDGRLLALNSYENRVYQVGVEDALPLIAKFYRPGRWSNEAILEEHAFALELATEEIPVVAPLVINDSTLHVAHGYRFALFPRQGGHWPELNTREEREWMGRFIARLHAVGATRSFRHRPVLDIDSFGVRASQFLLDNHFIPAHIETAYETLVADLLDQVAAIFNTAGNVRQIRLHGDCHPGNILWTGDGPHFVDLDDCRTGPPIQDLWMLLSGDRHEMQSQLIDIMEGYLQFFEFDHRELLLIEPLRTLRMIHYAAWLARRWQDPAFPAAFTWFNTDRYWEDHVLALREQAALLGEPPLVI